MEEEDLRIYLDMSNGKRITVTTKDLGETMDAIIAIKNEGSWLDFSSMSHFDAICEGVEVSGIDTSHISAILVPS